jgi:hypothetical protein
MSPLHREKKAPFGPFDLFLHVVLLKHRAYTLEATEQLIGCNACDLQKPKTGQAHAVPLALFW